PAVPIKPIDKEREVLAKASQGCERAFEILFHAYHQPLGEFVLLLTESPELTEEIISDVFVKLWVDRKRLTQVEKFTSYLFILCRNYTLNSIRKLASERKRKEVYEKDIEKDLFIEELRESLTEDYQQLIDQAVAQLPPRQQKVFTLRMEGMKNKEIATQMGLTPDSVKKYQQWAVQSISRFVKSYAALTSMLFALLFFRS